MDRRGRRDRLKQFAGTPSLETRAAAETIASTLGLSVLALLAACGDTPTRLEAMRPSLVSARVDTAVSLKGKNFYSVAQVDLDQSQGIAIESAYELTIGDNEDALIGQFVDLQTLDFVLPAGLALGDHSIALTLSDGRSYVLDNAFEVVECLADVCGDGYCCGAVGENSCDCPSDCADSCGDGCCQASEDALSCAVDCADATCGDGLCTGSESALSCLQDCADNCGGTSQWTAFSPPTLINEVTTSALDNAPTLSPDELTMIIHSNRAGGLGQRDLWMSTRSSRLDAFSTPVNMQTVNSSANEFGPSLSFDQLELYFGSSRPGGRGGYDIWKARRSSIADDFDAPTHLANVNSSSTDYLPVISSDGLSLYFASTRVGGLGSYDIWLATRSSTLDDFSTPVNLLGVNSSSGEEAVVVSFDERTFMTQSTRSGGVGTQDVWMTTRVSIADPFANLYNLTEVNSGSNDQATWLSPDGKRLYQSSNRDGAWNIYLSERSCVAASSH